MGRGHSSLPSIVSSISVTHRGIWGHCKHLGHLLEMWQSEALQSLKTDSFAIKQGTLLEDFSDPFSWLICFPPKWSKLKKRVIQTNKFHFIYFVSQILLMWCASLTSKIYPDLSCATLSSTQPRLRYSCNDLRSLIRKKIVSNLAKARQINRSCSDAASQAVETTVSRNLNYVNG